MLVLVCGGRDYSGDVSCLSKIQVTMIIQGGANGADRLAKEWAKARGIHHAEVEALWDIFSKPAGSKRNAAMLILRPAYCVAFPGGTGTNDMVKQCESHNIPVWRPYG